MKHANQHELEGALYDLFESFKGLASAMNAAGGRQERVDPGGDFSSAVTRIYGLLPDNVALQDERDLSEVLHKVVQEWAVGSDHTSPSRLVEALLAGVSEPGSRHVFSLPLATHARFGFEGSLGVRRNLRLSSVQRDDRVDNFELLLTGACDSLTPERAADEAERALEEVAGALLALGLADCSRNRGRNPGAPRLVVTVNGNREFAATGTADDLAAALDVGVIFGLSDLETRAFGAGDIESALGRKVAILRRALEGGEDDARSCLAACRFVARSCVTREYGAAVNYAFMALETVLLDRDSKDNVLARLIEAVVHGGSTPKREQPELRKFLKNVYDDRSAYVHTGSTKIRRGARGRLLLIAGDVVRRQMEQLPPDSDE